MIAAVIAGRRGRRAARLRRAVGRRRAGTARGRDQPGARVGAAVADHHHDPHRPVAARGPVRLRRHTRSSPVPGAARRVTEQHNFSAHTLTLADTKLSASGRRYTFVRWAGQRDPDQAFRPTVQGLPMRADYTVTASFAVMCPVSPRLAQQDGVALAANRVSPDQPAQQPRPAGQVASVRHHLAALRLAGLPRQPPGQHRPAILRAEHAGQRHQHGPCRR